MHYIRILRLHSLMSYSSGRISVAESTRCRSIHTPPPKERSRHTHPPPSPNIPGVLEQDVRVQIQLQLTSPVPIPSQYSGLHPHTNLLRITQEIQFDSSDMIHISQTNPLPHGPVDLPQKYHIVSCLPITYQKSTNR